MPRRYDLGVHEDLGCGVAFPSLTESGVLNPPVYHRRESRGSGPGVLDRDGVWWEEISSLQRLREITPATAGDSLTIWVDFKSLRGEPYRVDSVVHLPDSVVLYRDTPDLQLTDPRLTSTCFDFKPTVGFGDFLLAIIPSRFTGVDELDTPSGVDVLVERFQVDVGGFEEGQQVPVASNPDVFLNPQGALSVYLDIDRPRNGTYEIELLVNGEPVERVSLEALAPPEDPSRFDFSQVRLFRPDSSTTPTHESSPR